jgi:hypothetical protein
LQDVREADFSPFWLRSLGKTGIIATEVFVPRSEIIFTVEESPEGGYEARAVGYPIFTQSGTLEELKSSLQDAVRCHFDDAARPQLIRIHFVKDEVIPV